MRWRVQVGFGRVPCFEPMNLHGQKETGGLELCLGFWVYGCWLGGFGGKSLSGTGQGSDHDLRRMLRLIQLIG